MPTRRDWLAAASAAVALAVLSPRAALARATRPLLRVRKNPGCGCCDNWVAHMKELGFDATVVEDPDLHEYKRKLGVPRELVSCHTAEVDGYVIEGHVPGDLVQRIIREKPAITGLGVGGMPMGSPGMDGGRKDPYDVVAFKKDGSMMVYAHR
ncbi:MAG: DUF411 domain-containing protein [Longimicrobiales bacterium]